MKAGEILGKKNVILIVEDELINRRILKKILQHNYDVIEAENGKEGFDILMKSRDSITAVLLDIVMPVMDGYKFLELCAEEGIRDLPIIVTTGASDSKSEQKVLDAGAWDFVTKPYNPIILMTRLNNAIARSQIALYKQMKKMAAHDPLTNLHNRGRMFERTRLMIEENPDTEFIFFRFDIDHFALFNTAFGEKEGNRLLKYFANCVSEFAETFKLYKYGRMNADVFCACCSNDFEVNELIDKVEDVQKRLSAYKNDYLLALSVGVCKVDDKALSVDDLYFRSTVAAKNCKNQYETHLAFYNSADGEKLSVSISIQNEMQSALDEEQFVVYLQPKVRVTTEKICGAEALVRWVHPKRGMIPPGKFIPVFENNGFISKLDYYVWDKTCEMLRKWTDEGRPVYPVSVNISRVSLYNPKLTELLKGLVEKHKISPSLLQLEITESAYMSDPDLMEKTIESLHMGGFTILMDDFGSGYSSLNTLKRIYIDVLKIDMKFLPVDDETERGDVILACIIKMANLLGMSVVTEGVETRRQRDFLESAGCDVIQGYYYSRPIPQKEYEQNYLTEHESSSSGDDIDDDDLSPKNNYTVLVIDDSDIERELIKENLKEMYHVYLCENAESGLVYLKKHMSKIRLILVDNVMPGMTGMDFLKYCRVSNSLNAIPKIMITANDTVQDQVDAFAAGAYDYIAKPVTKEILLARVSHAMAISSQTFTFESIEREYKMLSERDTATGLLNKVTFHELSARILQATTESVNGLMIIDIDDFKQLNDEYGHLSGDNIIKCIAEVLKNSLRNTDIIGRFGGDEFVVLMAQIPNAQIAKKKAAEIIKSVNFSCLHQYDISVTVSIGIAFSDGDDNEEAMFARADQALYDAKRMGKGKSVVYGENVPQIIDDNKPIVLICSENPQIYPSIAFEYGDTAGFINIVGYSGLVENYNKYQKRVKAVCIDMSKENEEDAQDFKDFIVNRVQKDNIPVLAFCSEGNIEQMRNAINLNVMDIMALPPHMDIVQRRILNAVNQCETNNKE